MSVRGAKSEKGRKALDWLKQNPAKSDIEAATFFGIDTKTIYNERAKAKKRAKSEPASKQAKPKRRKRAVPTELTKPGFLQIEAPAQEGESTVIIIKTRNLRDTLKDFL